jgi:hypothetical protein
MGLRPTEGDEKRLGPATTFHETVALSFVILRLLWRKDGPFRAS